MRGLYSVLPAENQQGGIIDKGDFSSKGGEVKHLCG